MLRWACKLHKHIGLVPAFLLIFNRITHASIRPPVKMPFKLLRITKGAGIKHAHKAANDTLQSHAPTGNSSDKN